MLVGAKNPAGDEGPQMAAIARGRFSARDCVCRRCLSKVRAP